jgi:predicted  nucleic acid-binding Zn-ribbon protein
VSSEPIRTEPTNHGTPAVQEALDKLRALQDVLHKKHEIEAQIEELPRSLATKTELLNRLKRTYLERNEEQGSTKTRIDGLRGDAVESEQVREEYERQMDQIRTQREYEALDKQIRDASDREMDYRRALQEEEERLEQVSEELAREAELIEQQEGVVHEEESRIKVELADREGRLAALKTEESEIAAGLEQELLFKFERIVRSTDGYGIVPLQGQICTGCYMALPAHFVNRVRRAEDMLFCTHGRIVFYEDTPDEDETEAQIDVFDDEPGFFADADGDDETEEAEELFLGLDVTDDDDDGDDGDHEDHAEQTAGHESDDD